jgi:alkaline phosphatase
LVRTLLRADRHEEPQQDESAGDEQPQHQPNVVLGGEDAHDDQDEADREQDRATQVEGPARVRRKRILHLSAQQEERRDDQRLEAC